MPIQHLLGEPTPTKSVRTFDVAGAATYLDVSQASVQRWAKSGRLKGFRDMLHAGGPWRFNSADLDAYRASLQVGNNGSLDIGGEG